MTHLKSFLLIGIFTIFCSVGVFAQQAGSLKGQVVDANGAVIVGATVTTVDAAGKIKTAITNQRGEFSVSGLAPGKYTVRAIADKFGLYENAEVQINSGAAEDLTVVLSVAEITTAVDVSAANDVSTDPNSNTSAQILTDKEIAELPEDPDDLEAALQALAGPSAGPTGGQIYIDGFTGGRLPPRESIREIRINQNPFSAEFERLGFGRIEVLTKPGSDKLRGQAYFNFNDEALNSRNPFALNRAPSQTRNYGGNLSGPIQKGKSSFFFDISNRTQDANSIINANILDASFNVIPFQQDILIPTRRFSFSPRLDYQLNSKNTLVARYSYTRNRFDNQGIGGLNLLSRASSSSSTENEFRLTETAILNPKTVNETRFQFESNRRDQTGDNSIPTISVSDAFIGGGAQIGNNFNNNNSFELSNYTTTSFGANNQHAIKFGARVRAVKIEDQSESGFGGTFTFAGVRDPVTGALLYTSIEQYRQKLLGNPDPRFNPSQFIITSGDPLAGVSQYDVGLFVTDDWKVRQDLTLSFGLRYENQNNISDNTNFAPRFSFAYSPGASGARQPKTVFRGGAGVFFDRFGENFTLQTDRFNGSNQIQYTVTNNPTILAQPIFTLNGVTNVPTIAQVAAVAPGAFTVRRTSSDLQAPTTYQYALSVERQLPYKIRGSISYVGSRTIHQLRTRNINAPICGLTSVCPTTAAEINLLRPDVTQGNIYEYESNGVSNQQQLIFSANAQLTQKISIRANYRLGYAKGDTDGAGNFPAYSYNLNGEYGSASQDIRHFFSLFGNFQLPWRISMSPIITARSGTPFNIITGVDSNRDSLFTERPTFAQLNAACVQRGLTYSFCDVSDVSNTSAVIPRNYGRGPAFLGVNLNFNKTIGFGKSRSQLARTTDGQAASSAGEGANRSNGSTPNGGGRAGGGNRGGGGGGGNRGGGGGGGFGGGGFGGGGGFSGGGSDKPYNLTFGLQISNLFNRVNFASPVGNLSSNRFGQYTSIIGGSFGGFGGFGNNGTANRRVDLSLRFSF